MRIPRDVALTEVYLDTQARFYSPRLPAPRARMPFASILGLVGTVFAVVWYLGPKFI